VVRSRLCTTAVLGLTALATLATRAAVLAANYAHNEALIVAAVKRVAPSVVALTVTVNGVRRLPVDPFAELFGRERRVQRIRAQVSGSGFVVARSGLIATTAHTADGASAISVLFANGDRVPAHVVETDSANDLALLQVDGSHRDLPPPAELGARQTLQPGQWAIAIGEPLELRQSVALGVVSGFDREAAFQDARGGHVHELRDLLQTSAPINPGNAGGPLIDANGRVIGINEAAAEHAQGIGFAIPAGALEALLSHRLAGGGRGAR
jgi:S1-C subfamily serine protease